MDVKLALSRIMHDLKHTNAEGARCQDIIIRSFHIRRNRPGGGMFGGMPWLGKSCSASINLGIT